MLTNTQVKLTHQYKSQISYQKNGLSQYFSHESQLTLLSSASTQLASDKSNNASFCYSNFKLNPQNSPITDCVDLRVVQRGKEIKLKSYHFPASNPKQSNGIIFYLHGYFSSINYEAVIGDLLSKNGNFDVFGIDQRGFGQSEGLRGIIEDRNDVFNDQWLLINTVVRKYKIDQQKTPLFLFGRSYGGLIATHMSNSFVGSRMFKACTLLTPFYKLYDPNQNIQNRIIPLAKFVSPVIPFFQILTPEQKQSKEYKAKWGHILEQTESEKVSFTPRTVVIFDNFNKEVELCLKNSKMPYYAIIAQKDTVVENEKIHEYMKTAQNSRVQTFQEVDHVTILRDPKTISTIVRNAINFFNQYIENEEVANDDLLFPTFSQQQSQKFIN